MIVLTKTIRIPIGHRYPNNTHFNNIQIESSGATKRISKLELVSDFSASDAKAETKF